MAKTPYEIRLETLQLAFDIVNSQKTAVNNNEGVGNYVAPTTDEVIKEGLRLREFIDNDRIDDPLDRLGKEGLRMRIRELETTIEEMNKQPTKNYFYIHGGDLDAEEIQKIVDEFKERSERERFAEKLKSDGSACCGGTGGNNCECNS